MVERELTEADIQALWDLPEGGLASVTRPLVKIRQRHHMLARLLAGGTKEAEASLITGYQVASISILKQDPAFKELLSYYETQKEEVFVDFFERLKILGFHTIDEILDRFESNPEDFSNEDLQKLLTIAADRTGYAPSKNVNISGAVGVITSEHLLKIKEEVSKRQNGTVERLGSESGGLEMGRLIEQKPLAEEAQVLEPSEEGSGL